MNEIKKICRVSEYSFIIYVAVKTPVFITERDMVLLVWVYTFRDGSVLMGSRSILHDDYPPKKSHVRAHISLNMWHIRPDFINDLQYSRVTYYAHINLNGSLPSWLINQASVDMPSSVLKVRTYMMKIKDRLHVPGVLNIPPYCALLNLGIDIGWLMPTDDDGNGSNETPNGEEVDAKIDDIPFIPIPEYPSTHMLIRNPAMMISNNDNHRYSSSTSNAPSNPMPNALFITDHNIMNINMNREQITDDGCGTNGYALPTMQPSSMNLTRKQWNDGTVIRLSDISLTPAMQMNTSLLSMTNTNNNNTDDQHKLVRSKSSPIHPSSTSYSLSVRDVASYMTIANCAVSDLLNQTDTLSKQYWIPLDTSAPRGIFIYSYINSADRYFHYMGKAILHHEPQFIFDALSDPSFRFAYDVMCDTTQVLEKLDDHTYIARYTHTAKQCYIKQKREAVVVIRHRTVCPSFVIFSFVFCFIFYFIFLLKMENMSWQACQWNIHCFQPRMD